MPQDPGPDGTYKDVAGATGLDETEAFDIVFKVPRLEAHVQDGLEHYTIVLPKYVAEEMRQQAVQELADQYNVHASSASAHPN
jgi:hypothetical protein